MSTAVAERPAAIAALTKAKPNEPAIYVSGPRTFGVRAGTTLDVGILLAVTYDQEFDLGDTEPGTDIAVFFDADGKLSFGPYADLTLPNVIGGFHLAPGGNASGRSGGGDTPAINPNSVWDLNFRPACPDPRGMTFVANVRGAEHVAPFWCDIYLLAADHLEGTSQFEATIADGRNLPETLDGSGTFKKLDYATAVDIFGHHGKQLLSFAEFTAAAYGVTEKTAAGDRIEETKLEPARTSVVGVIQATGQRWVWGHDGDPDKPRASLFGGSFWDDGNAGSRCANVASGWPGSSGGDYGARGRSDHVNLG